MPSARPASGSARDALLLACLFLSGVAGLLYEVCWIRTASLDFGSTVFATSAVLAVFFLGLALGNHLFGRATSRIARPLRLYAALELALGALGLATLPGFTLAERLYGAAFRALGDASAPLWAAHVALLALVILPPTVLMGGTLPLFCRRFVLRPGGIARSVGFLYGLNTLGAALGCALAGLVLLPAWGMARTVALAAALNALAGLGVLALRTPDLERASAPAPPAATGPGRSAAPERAARLILAFAFVAGLAALAQEVLWTRFLALVVRNTVYTYTLTLGVVLLGIVLGSLLASRLFDRALPRAVVFGALQVGFATSTLALMMLPAGFWQGLRTELWAYVVLLLVPAILSGAAFPLAVRMVVEDPALAGVGVGRVAASNTLGGIVGALVTGFLLLPRVGLHTSTLIVTGASLVGGIAAWALLATTTSRARLLVASAAAVLVWAALPWIARTRLPGDFLANGGELVDFREGLQSNLAVIRRAGVKSLEIDRWWQGQDLKTHQVMAAHLPMLLHPDPRRVLVVGVGAGQTPARFLMYGPERLDCVDIEPAVFSLIRSHFDGAWMNDPRVRLLRTDGRNLIAHTAGTYDVISLEVGQIFRPGIAAFYTADFYRRARARLAPRGLVSQFVPMPFLHQPSFRSVLSTFLEVFPNSVLWYNTSELLLIGANGEPPALDAGRLRLLDDNPLVHEDLEYAYWGGAAYHLNRPEVLIGGFLCGPQALRALAAGAPPFRDDRPALEYATSTVWEGEANEIALLADLRLRLDPVESILRGAADPKLAAAARRVRDINLRDIVASAYLRQIEAARRTGDREAAVTLAGRALTANPENVEAHGALGDALLLLDRLDEAATHYALALASRPGDAPANRGLAIVLHRQGRMPEAIAHYRASLAAAGEDADTHNNLGAALGEQGDLDGAEHEFERALALRPGDADALRNLGRVRAALRARPLPPAGKP